MLSKLTKSAALALVIGAAGFSANAASLDTVTAVSGGPEVTGGAPIQAHVLDGELAGMTGGPVSGGTQFFNYDSVNDRFTVIGTSIFVAGKLLESEVSGSEIRALYETDAANNGGGFASYLLMTITAGDDFTTTPFQTISSLLITGAEETMAAIPVPPAILALLTGLGALGFAGRRKAKGAA